jgi:uncharacterized protein (DUF1810 family)
VFRAAAFCYSRFMPADPFNLARFVDAQSGGVYERALTEISEGRKRSHWMWFIFPQHQDLGRSDMARQFGLSGTAEARAFAQHPLLGDRLRTCCAMILECLQAGRSAVEMLGPVDAMKLASSMDIFIAADPGEPLFAEVRRRL